MDSRYGRTHVQGFPGDDDGLCSVSRPSVRPDLARRVLSLPQHFRAGPGGHRQWWWWSGGSGCGGSGPDLRPRSQRCHQVLYPRQRQDAGRDPQDHSRHSPGDRGMGGAPGGRPAATSPSSSPPKAGCRANTGPAQRQHPAGRKGDGHCRGTGGRFPEAARETRLGSDQARSREPDP